MISLSALDYSASRAAPEEAATQLPREDLLTPPLLPDTRAAAQKQYTHVARSRMLASIAPEC